MTWPHHAITLTNVDLSSVGYLVHSLGHRITGIAHESNHNNVFENYTFKIKATSLGEQLRNDSVLAVTA